ncbi:hypothetical protein E2C01_061110 [Portunus trituberculatus]|uniref:Uncharacterized protein n=1 Tax=Portunus trituberculatus TaxID=210409 RepID=A0A5B7H300_PORTR|nr:hypothetical protein [Portunus trituberculatus]
MQQQQQQDVNKLTCRLLTAEAHTPTNFLRHNSHLR